MKEKSGDVCHGNVLNFPVARSMRESGQENRSVESEFLKVLNDALNDLDDLPENDLDRKSLECEETFRARFGIDAPRRWRRLLIEYKHSADLTDREIRHLVRAGRLTFSAHSVVISVPLGFVIVGWLQMASLSLMAVWAVHVLDGLSRISVRQYVVGAMFLLACASLAWHAFRIYLLPRQIWRRVVASASIDSR